MANNFEQMKKIGKEGEAVVETLLRNDDRVWGFEDVSEKDEWQGKDVDFLVLYESDDGMLNDKTIEVKTDERAGSTGNFFVEAKIVYKHIKSLPEYVKKQIRKDNKGAFFRKGWAAGSAAEYFIEYVPKHEKLYIILAEDLRRYIVENNPEKRTKRDSANKTVHGWLIPIMDLCNNYPVMIYDLEQ